MARIVGYIAASLDGYIAGPDDSLEWLTPKYDDLLGGDNPFSYEDFIGRIRTTVMGRATYDWLVAQGNPAPYPDKRTIIVSSKPTADLPPGVEIWSDGVEALVSHLRALDDGDVWMVGGAQLQMAFMERGALDELEIYLIPELLGGGTPLFPATGLRRPARLISSTTLRHGCVRLHYALD